MDLSIILVNYNERDATARVVTALEKEFQNLEHEIFVIDNASTDGSAEYLRTRFPNVQLIESGQNLYYGKGNNEGLKKAIGKWILIINSDVEWSPGQVRRLFDAAQIAPDVVLVPAIWSSNGHRQLTAHRRFPTLWTVFIDYCLPLQQLALRLPQHPYLYSQSEHATSRTISHATGVCLLVPRAVYEKIGGFDPKFSMYLEETDWQRRMSDAGIIRKYIAESSITHFGSAQKTFAQASRHYLWSLRYYARQHWSKTSQLLLPLIVWAGALISDAILLCAWPFSWFLGRPGRRVRHYAVQCLRLTRALFSWPTHTPA